MRKMILRAGRIARLHPIVQVSRSVVDSVSVVESESAEARHSVVESVSAEARRNRVESESAEAHRSRVESVEAHRSRAASVGASVPGLCHRSLRHLIATRTG